MAKDIDFNKVLKDAQNALKNLPKEVLQQRPDLLKSANEVVKAVQDGDETKLNEYIKQNASHT